MRSSGRSATSGSRLFISMRRAASWCQPLQVRSLPRGARMVGASLVSVMGSPSTLPLKKLAVRARLSPAADAEQQVDDEVERGGRDGDDVEVLGVQVPLQERYRVEQEGGGGLEQRPEAVDGVRQDVSTLFDAQIDQRYVYEYQQDDQGEYRADETHASISFPSRPTPLRPGWLRGVRAVSPPHEPPQGHSQRAV